MDLGNGLGHLTYSTLVHPADTWDDLWQSVTTYLPRVKARVSPSEPFGVSLRLSAETAGTLHADPAERRRLARFLAENDMYVYTVNAFPYGPFKGRRVKEQVYEPDWRSDERSAYTMAVADVLAELAPEAISPSIQTSPLGFKPRVTGPEVASLYTEHVLKVAAHLADLERRTGRTVTLAIEPEPYCFLETTTETIDYFNREIYTATAAATLAGLAGLAPGEAESVLRRHVGIVFDACHQAVEYEDIADSLRRLVASDIPIFKLQQAAAIRVPRVTRSVIDSLREYARTIYLTQTYELRDGELNRFLNLEDAMAAWEEEPHDAEWRIHIHVPVFLDDLGGFRSTRAAIEESLAVHARTPLSRQLEVETYTWDVLPAHLKSDDIVDYVCRELEWVRGQLVEDERTAVI